MIFRVVGSMRETGCLVYGERMNMKKRIFKLAANSFGRNRICRRYRRAYTKLTTDNGRVAFFNNHL